MNTVVNFNINQLAKTVVAVVFLWGTCAQTLLARDPSSPEESQKYLRETFEQLDMLTPDATLHPALSGWRQERLNYNYVELCLDHNRPLHGMVIFALNDKNPAGVYRDSDPHRYNYNELTQRTVNAFAKRFVEIENEYLITHPQADRDQILSHVANVMFAHDDWGPVRGDSMSSDQIEKVYNWAVALFKKKYDNDPSIKNFKDVCLLFIKSTDPHGRLAKVIEQHGGYVPTNEKIEFWEKYRRESDHRRDEIRRANGLIH